jgi:DNA-binding response OmpR family regulator
LATKILIIEDDPAIRRTIQEELEFEGFELRFAESGGAGLEAIAQEPPTLVLLDLMLPDVSGFEVCKKIRETDPAIAIIVVSGRDADTDKVRGLDLGADDYITKPFSLAVLVARIRAVLRRKRGLERERAYVLGRLRLDVRRRETFVGDRAVQLTPKEFDLLKYLLEHQGEAVSRDEILDHVWPGVFVTARTVDTHVASLRKKLQEGPGAAPEVESVRGVGYKLRPAPDDASS